jgi:hypothetical protein
LRPCRVDPGGLLNLQQFAQLELRGILPRGERLVPISGREPANTIVWQCRFDSLCAAETALKQIDGNADHTELANKQHPMFQPSWVEFFEGLDCQAGLLNC